MLVSILLVVDSLHFIFARLLVPHLPPATSAMYVMAIATFQMVAFALIRHGRIRFDIFWRYKWFFLAIGLLIGISTSGNYLAVSFIDPGMAALLAKSGILFGVGFGIVWLRERLTRRQVIGAVIAISGVFIVAFQPGDYLRFGSLIVIGSIFLYSLHTALVKRYGGQMDIVTFFVFRLASTSGVLFLLNVATGGLRWPNNQAWLLLLVVGTVDIVISRGLYYLALRQLKLSVHTLILTASPVLAIIWTRLLFDIAPGVQQLVGGGCCFRRGISGIAGAIDPEEST